MSIALMTLAWKTDLPAGKKLVLLALCDNANDQGDCYPSIATIAQKCSMGERTVQQHIADLQGSGHVTRQMRTGRSTLYKIDSRRFCTPADFAPPQNLHPVQHGSSGLSDGKGHSTPADSAPPQDSHPSSGASEASPPQNLHPTPANSAPRPPQNSHPTPADFAPITVKEPSVEPSRKRQGARGTRLPADWVLTKSLGDWTLEEFPHWTADRLRTVASKFKDHWLAAAGSKGSKADWLATWRNWCRREDEMNPQGKQNHGAWFTTEQGVITKAAELGLKTLAGESAFSLKQRVQAAIDNGGKPPTVVSGQRLTAPPVEEPKTEVSAENLAAFLDAAKGLKKKAA